MINYSKRQSVQKNSSKKSLGRGLSNNKSHTSSINIKLSQDLSFIDNMKIPLKNLFRDKYEPNTNNERNKGLNQHKYTASNQKHKYSVKLQSQDTQEKQNGSKKKEYFEGIKPLGDFNRYLVTQRYSKQNLKATQRSISKHAENKLRTDYDNDYKKDSNSKQPLSNLGSIVTLPLQDMKNILQELVSHQKQIQDLEKQLAFYRRQGAKQTRNSVLRALKV